MKDLTKSKLVIVVGAGGVGKTTVASALGLYFAKRGQKTLVITVDPARRLLDALAIKDQADEPSRVNVEGLLGEKNDSLGELYVFMPNLKKEWADFLEIAISHADARHTITSNHFYQYMADGMPGAFEIICSHVMFRLMESGCYDKIILDTPPSSHSISFFDVPQKISRVLEQGVFRSLMNQRNSVLVKLTKKLAFLSGGILQKTIERIIGSHFLSELIDFALTIDALYEPLRERVRAMDRMLKDSNTKYALIARPTSASIQDSAYLKSALSARGISINQIIVNQVMPILDSEALKRELVLLKKDQSGVHAIEHFVELYLKERAREETLIKKFTSDFTKSDMKLLYLIEATASRVLLLTRLVANLELRGKE